MSRVQIANAKLVRKENSSRSVWKGKYPTRGPPLEEAVEIFGCMGAFVHQDGLRFETGSIGSLQDPALPLGKGQREGEDHSTKASEGRGKETGQVQVAELFGLTELIHKLLGVLRPLVESKENNVVFPISVDAGVGLQILDSLRIHGVNVRGRSAERLSTMLGGVRCLFFVAATIHYVAMNL